jgi:uncharacterized delta-60 repeat protein
VLGAAAPARAQGISLDPSFGGGSGLSQTIDVFDPTRFNPDDAHDVEVQPDGKILVTADGSGPLGERWWVVVRYLPDGMLDTSFGNGGAAVLEDMDGGTATGLELQRDGKIVITGWAHCLEKCFAAARLNPDGSLDPSFGDGGVARHDPIRRTEAYDVAIQRDGRIVLVGDWFKGGDANDDQVGCVMRLLPDGRLDRSFSRDGVVRFEHGHGDDHLVAVTIQERRIVAAGAGRLISGSRGGFGVVRLRRNGSFDRSFGRRGKRVVAFRHGAMPVGISTAPRGRLVIAGNAGLEDFGWQPAAARLNRNGSIDRRFGSRGRVRTRIGPSGGSAHGLLVDRRGRVVLGAGAESGTPATPDWVLIRYTARGRPDRTFAPGGVHRENFGTGPDVASALAPAGDRLVAAGAIGGGLRVARYLMP